ncbi:hypothetical protein EMCRGX_G017734 [Ephydatia muelleri]
MRVKAVNEKLSTEGQLILTLITLMHYNTFISWRMIHGLNFLMDTSSCSSNETYKKHLNNSFDSFRMFCIQLVDVIESSLGIPQIMGVGVDHLLSVVQEVEVEVNTAHDSPKTHHAILANSQALRSARMSGWGKKGRHPLICVKQSKTCPLCCDRSPSAPTHSRFGYRPSWCCSECNEFLCKRKRWTKTGNLVEVGWKENSQREKAELSCYEKQAYYFAHYFWCLDEPATTNMCEPARQFRDQWLTAFPWLCFEQGGKGAANAGYLCAANLAQNQMMQWSQMMK